MRTYISHYLLLSLLLIGIPGCTQTDQSSEKEKQLWDWLWEIPQGYRKSPSKYESVETWVQAGREIGDVEGMLIDMYREKPEYGWTIVSALGLVGSDRSVPVVIGALEDTDQSTVTNAVEALGNLRSEAAIDPLSKVALSTTDASLRAKATWSLSQIGHPSVRSTIEEALVIAERYDRRQQRTNDIYKAAIRDALKELDNRLSPVPIKEHIESFQSGRVAIGGYSEQVDDDDWVYWLVDGEQELICILFIKQIPQNYQQQHLSTSGFHSHWKGCDRCRNSISYERRSFNLSRKEVHKLDMFYISPEPDSIYLNRRAYDLCVGNVFLCVAGDDEVEIRQLRRIISTVEEGDIKAGIQEMLGSDSDIDSFVND